MKYKTNANLYKQSLQQIKYYENLSKNKEDQSIIYNSSQKIYTEKYVEAMNNINTIPRFKKRQSKDDA